MYTKDEIVFLRSQIALEVIRRDMGRCFSCDRAGVDVHEILPRSRFGRARADLCFDMRNSVLLCRECHSKSHTRKARSLLLAEMSARHGYTYGEEPFLGYFYDSEENADG